MYLMQIKVSAENAKLPHVVQSPANCRFFAIICCKTYFRSFNSSWSFRSYAAWPALGHIRAVVSLHIYCRKLRGTADMLNNWLSIAI